jgi:RNA polymerase sigma-70 factor (ECF subfamily)
MDEEAEFTTLVQHQSRFVFRVAYAVLLNAHDAEDVVQETFLKLYRNRGWQGVAWRIAVDRRPRSSQPTWPALEDDGTDDRPSPDPSPEQALLFSNQQAMVHSMIDALPEALRLPLVLSAFEELNSREIGGILGIPQGTVRTRLQHARQLLHQKLTNIQESRYA